MMNKESINKGDIVWFEYYNGLTGEIKEYTIEIINGDELNCFSEIDILGLEKIGTIKGE